MVVVTLGIRTETVVENQEMKFIDGTRRGGDRACGVGGCSGAPGGHQGTKRRRQTGSLRDTRWRPRTVQPLGKWCPTYQRRSIVPCTKCPNAALESSEEPCRSVLLRT